jgi:predicted dinucleotide-binding enzyme
MNIGIIGSGNVGDTFVTRWAKGGHQMTSGSRYCGPPWRSKPDLAASSLSSF